METQFEKYKALGNIIASQGQELLIALLILIIGLIIVKQLFNLTERILGKFMLKPQLRSTVNIIICTVFLFLIFAAVLHQIGIDPLITRRIILGACLIIIGAVALLRPMLPTLPFSVGNTVKVGDLLGKIEATTLLNTRMKTFDGKTVFIPNSKIINDFVINYHYTKTRRVKVDVSIRFDQDILAAKQLLETLMISDPRVEVNPRPQVYFLSMENNCIKLGGRCWVKNLDYWTARCDLIEKTKLGFDHAGIKIAFPPREIHNFSGETVPDVSEV
jgi:small conductance mechanosensitive channel